MIISIVIVITLIVAAMSFMAGTFSALPGNYNEALSEADYVIYKTDLGTTVAINGTTGRIDYSSINPAHVIQQCIDNYDRMTALSILIKSGHYNITDTILANSNGLSIRGDVTNMAASGGTVLEYDGAGTCIFVNAADLRLQRVTIEDLSIKAIGAAQTLATNRGIWAENVEKFAINRVSVRDFVAGSGIYLTCTVASYTADVNIANCFVYNCNNGIFAVGDSDFHEVNTVTISGCIIIGGVASDCGIQQSTHCDRFLYVGGDIESVDCAYIVYGKNSVWTGTRSEFITTDHFQINSPAGNNTIYSHRFYGGATYRSGANSHYPNTTFVNCNPWINERYGLAHIVASTTVSIIHGLGSSIGISNQIVPDFVSIATNSTTMGGWTFVADATYLNITVEHSGSYAIYWYARGS
jgi:hypothetical protein